MLKTIGIARRFAGMRTIDLAQAVGNTSNQISLWESGARNPSRAAIAELARALGVDPAWIAGFPQLCCLGAQAVPIVRSEAIPDYGVLQHVYLPEQDSIIAVVRSGDIVFTSPGAPEEQPRSAAEIPAHRWVDGHLRPAVMIRGLPYIPSMAAPRL